MHSPTWRLPGNYESCDFTKAIDELNPVNYIIEDSKTATLAETFEGIAAENLSTIALPGAIYMIYGIVKSYELMAGYERIMSKKYSKIIRYRFDLKCLDPKQFTVAITKVGKQIDFLCVKHNWAGCYGAVFDGVFASSREGYKDLIKALSKNFYQRYFRHFNAGINMPELVLSDIITEQNLRCGIAESRFSIIRDHGFEEQIFGGNSNILDRFRSLVVHEKKFWLDKEWYLKTNPFLLPFSPLSILAAKLIAFVSIKFKT